VTKNNALKLFPFCPGKNSNPAESGKKRERESPLFRVGRAEQYFRADGVRIINQEVGIVAEAFPPPPTLVNGFPLPLTPTMGRKSLGDIVFPWVRISF
jgi:hypothetical protein